MVLLFCHGHFYRTPGGISVDHRPLLRGLIIATPLLDFHHLRLSFSKNDKLEESPDECKSKRRVDNDVVMAEEEPNHGRLTPVLC